ncbi:hypothetical protein E2C01_011265 [Portunus trituberculatus]|uniref:Uncharacterized protein n=1 Tax=Portunus trituberculatus TaxID=210409 RepID=A0A5B7DB85_PORTR|nr:hypothetical protein [Portunus trituberculatus]
MNEATLCAMHRTLAVRGGSFRDERAHFMTVFGEWCVAGQYRVGRGKIASSVPSHLRDCWGGPLGRKSSSRYPYG